MWLADHIFHNEKASCGFEGDVRFTLDGDFRRDNPALHHVTSMFAGLYPEQAATPANLTQLLYGEPFEVHKSDGEMAYGRSLTDGYVGWVASSALATNWLPPSHLVSAPLAPLYEKPHLKQTPLMHLPMAAMVNATGTVKNGYIEIEGGFWLFAKYLAEDPVSERSLLDIGKLFLGSPYVWGGRTMMGIDCSGLLQVALAMTGMRCERDSDTQFKTLGTAVAKDDLQAGDLAFFPGHVGIMTDGENILHANATHMAVTIDPLEEVIGWVARDMQDKKSDRAPFLGGKRL